MDFNENAVDQTDYSYIRNTINTALKIHGGGFGYALGGKDTEEWMNLLSLAASESGAEFVKITAPDEIAGIESFIVNHNRVIERAAGTPLIIAVDTANNQELGSKLSDQALVGLSNMIGNILDNSQNVVYVQVSDDGVGQFFLNAHRTLEPISASTPKP